MKKYLLFLVATMLATVARAAVGDTFTYEELNFVVISEDDHTAAVDRNESASGDITIPSVVKYGESSYSVTEIGKQAFLENSYLTSVTIPNSVTYIGASAFFYCNNLTSVSIPNSVTEIREYTFDFCENLASVTIPNSVTKIGASAFYYCNNLTSITIPNSVTYIGEEAFAHCYSLSSITIPSSVTTILDTAFMGGINMTEIIVEDGNPNYSSDNGVLFNVDKTKLLQCPGGKTGEYTIPNSVAIIGFYAFGYCQSLTSVTIPSSVNHIEESAFIGCIKLQTICNQNPTPQSLGNDVFYGVPQDVVVYIPKGSLDKYTETEGWNYFTDFREMGTTDVDEIVTDDEVPVDAYNLQGVEVLRGAAASELSKLPAGLYIVRQGKSIKKMIVK